MTEPIKNYTIAEVAQLLRCSERHVFKLMATGKLKVVRIGHRTLVREQELHRLLARHEAK